MFGYRSKADTVAAKLAASGFFLQDPHYIPPGFCYENPQYLDLPAISLGAYPTIEAPVAQKEFHADDLALTRTDDFELDFDSILDTFACRDGLTEASAVSQILTPLLRYTPSTFSKVKLLKALLVTRKRAWTLYYSEKQIQRSILELCGNNSKQKAAHPCKSHSEEYEALP